MNAQWPHGKNRGVDYLVTALEALTALAAAGYVISGNVVMLVVWEAIAAEIPERLTSPASDSCRSPPPQATRRPSESALARAAVARES